MDSRELIRIVIVEEVQFLRLGLVRAVEFGDEIEVLGDFGLVSDALAEVERLKPDVVLMSISMPDVGGIDACRAIPEKSPATKVVLLAAEERDQDALASIMSGSSGYFLKTTGPPELVQMIRLVAGGGSYFDAGLTERVLARVNELVDREPPPGLDALTDRETEVLTKVAEGMSNNEIGATLNVSANTVRNHISNIFKKLNMSRRAELISFVTRHGVAG